MRSTKNSTGRRTLTCTIKTSLDCELLTTYALDMLLEKPDPLTLLLKCNKREIFILARLDLTRFGRYVAHERVPVKYTKDEFDQALEYVRSIFPEVD